jgi:hypothetical protein
MKNLIKNIDTAFFCFKPYTPSKIAKFIKNRKRSWVPVAHTCNPSYSGVRHQEDLSSSKPRQIVHKTLSQKTHNNGLVEWLKV